MKKPPLNLSSSTLFDTFFTVVEEKLQLENKKISSHYKISLPKPHSVTVIAVTNENKIVINREWRPPVNQFVWSLPGGFMEDGEDPVSAGKRELQEETGYQSEKWKLLGKSYPMPGICTVDIAFTLALDAKLLSPATPEEGEIIETTVLSFKEIHSLLQEGEAIDGILLTGLCMAEVLCGIFPPNRL